jgi:hypothetical protein
MPNVELTDKEYKEILRLREIEEKKKEPPILELARQFVRAEQRWISAINSDRRDSDICQRELEKAQKYLIEYK